MADDGGYCADLVKAVDRPRYYAALHAPRPSREALLSIYAFAAELSRIPAQVSDPTLGELRLEWWRTELSATLDGEGEGGSPVIRSLVKAIRESRLPAEPFLNMIDARVADLYSDPPESREALEGHLGETESAIFQMAAVILAGDEAVGCAEASGHAGIAYGLARALGGLGVHPGNRLLVPADRLAEGGVSPEAAASGARSPELDAALADLASFARTHLESARRTLAGTAVIAGPAFLPLAVVEPALARAERGIAGEAAPLSQLQILARVSWAAWRGGLGR